MALTTHYLLFWSELARGTIGYTYDRPVWQFLILSSAPCLVMLLTTRWPFAVTLTVAFILGYIISSGIGERFGGWQSILWVLVQTWPFLGMAWWLTTRTNGRPVGRPWGAVFLLASTAAVSLVDVSIASGRTSLLFLATFALPAVYGALTVWVDPRVFIAAALLWLSKMVSMGGAFLTMGETVWGVSAFAAVALVTGVGGSLLVQRSIRNLTRI